MPHDEGVTQTPTHATPEVLLRTERRAFGKARRHDAPRTGHAAWTPAPHRADPLALLEESERGRLPQLLPIRHARMAASAFAFYRGNALAMAADLAATPVSGITTQICGDAHCANFGGFATPEGNVIFDVNDFDETLPGPWEWDVKRLAASLVLAARNNHLTARDGHDAALGAVASYRQRMLAYADMTTLEVWTDRIDASPIVAITTASDERRARKQLAQRTQAHSVQHRYHKLTTLVDGKVQLAEEPVKIFHPDAAFAEAFGDVNSLLHQYRRELRDDVRTLFDRYRFADWVVKIVGVGSVGTRCGAVLFLADVDDPLILQIKEALPSVLEAFVKKSTYANHGHRVITGQRLMQAASDIFLGWASDGAHCFYIRQLRALKGSPELDALDATELATYGAWCGRALAASHARAGEPNAIAGYLGGNDVFEHAIADFAGVYADQVEKDFAIYSDAVKSGRIATST